MSRANNILLSSILLTLIFFQIMGISVERCSCTGEVKLVLGVDEGCCDDEQGCMTLKTMELSDFMPTTTTSLDLPHQPVLFILFTRLAPVQATLPQWRQEVLYAKAPPEALAQTVTVLQV